MRLALKIQQLKFLFKISNVSPNPIIVHLKLRSLLLTMALKIIICKYCDKCNLSSCFWSGTPFYFSCPHSFLLVEMGVGIGDVLCVCVFHSTEFISQVIFKIFHLIEKLPWSVLVKTEFKYLLQFLSYSCLKLRSEKKFC